jgi:hypothetical protein
MFPPVGSAVTDNHSALIRFVNDYDRPSAIHLHGSYSRAPFDGWAEDVIQPGQYKVTSTILSLWPRIH